MMKTEDILSVAALFLPFLKKGNKKQNGSGSNDLDRFKDYPDSTGNFGGGYYDKLTQEALTEKSKKEDALYCGDKSDNAVYDPFYKVSQKELDILNMRDSEDPTDVEERGQVLRVRIVPNSFFCANYDTERLVESPFTSTRRQEHVYACVVELYNPFPANTGSRGKITLTSLSYKIASEGNEMSDLGIKANGKNLIHYLTSTEYWLDSAAIEKRITKGIFNFFKKFADPQLEAYEDLPTSIPPQTSIYLPVFLSYLPDESGNITRSVMPLPLGSGIDFTKYTYPVRSFEMSLRVGVRQGSSDGRLHVCKISSEVSQNSYKWAADKSESTSTQLLEYFRPWSTPIYSRSEFWNALFLQKQLDLSSKTGGRAARSYWWSYSYLHEVEKFANPFGAINLSNI